MSEEIEAVDGEEAAAPQGAGTTLEDNIEADAMFAEELEAETVPVPHWEGCYFVLQPVDGVGLTRLYGAAQHIITDPKTGNLQAGGFRVEEFEKALVCATVVDFVLKRKSRVVGTNEYILSEVRATAKADPKQRPQYIREQLCGDEKIARKGLSPGLWRWLVAQCAAINRMDDTARGN